MNKGIITIINKNNEKFLQKWIDLYSLKNFYPVTFFYSNICSHTINIAKNHGKVLHFLKDLEILLKTPYEKCIFIDIKCSVKNNLTPLFEITEGGGGIGMSTNSLLKPNPEVFAFQKSSSVIQSLKKETEKTIKIKEFLELNQYEITKFSNSFFWKSSATPPKNAIITLQN